jgi:hypothetical protein
MSVLSLQIECFFQNHAKTYVAPIPIESTNSSFTFFRHFEKIVRVLGATAAHLIHDHDVKN